MCKIFNSLRNFVFPQLEKNGSSLRRCILVDDFNSLPGTGSTIKDINNKFGDFLRLLYSKFQNIQSLFIFRVSTGMKNLARDSIIPRKLQDF